MHEKYRIGLRALLLGTAALTGLQYDFARAAEEEAFGSVSEIVILGTLADRDILENLRGVSRTEIDPSEIETRQIRIVSDLLRDVPGIAVSRTGPAGGSTQVRIRGAEGNHTLVLIDGMEASEPFQGEFDFATLLADDIAEIEVLRGQQSALYGSDAIGGVIHYTTPSGRDYPGFRARTEGGSFGTYAGAARLGGYEGGFDYVVGATYNKTDGVVVARQGNDEVGSKSVGAYAKFAFAPAENFFLTAVARYSGLDTDTSPQDFGFPPDPDTFGYAIDGENTDDADAYYALV
jgi:vitamin B12 transporter